MLSVFPTAPGTWASPSDGVDAGFGVELRARPFTFLRFMVRGLNASAMIVVVGRTAATGCTIRMSNNAIKKKYLAMIERCQLIGGEMV